MFDLKVHTDQGMYSMGASLHVCRYKMTFLILLFPSGLEATDYTQLWNDLRQEISLVDGPKTPLPGQGTFNHIMGGYDAGAFFFFLVSIIREVNIWGTKGYYGYMYSLVFAADMYATVFKNDPLDPALGERYKNSILVPGGSREELDSLGVRCYRSFTPGRCEVGANSNNLLPRNSLAAHRTQKLLRSSCSAIRRPLQLIFNLEPYFMALFDRCTIVLSSITL